MKNRWLVVVCTGLGVLSLLALAAADPASARTRHKAPRHCVDGPFQFSWQRIFWGGPAPQPNGCAPPVYDATGRYIGQDPDPNIRFMLKRDPRSGYHSY